MMRLIIRYGLEVLVDHPFVEDTNDDRIIRSWVGAGFVVDKSLGLIVTNAHVSGVGNTYIKIAFKGEKFLKAELIYVDPELALVKEVDSKKNAAKFKRS